MLRRFPVREIYGAERAIAPRMDITPNRNTRRIVSVKLLSRTGVRNVIIAISYQSATRRISTNAKVAVPSSLPPVLVCHPQVFYICGCSAVVTLVLLTWTRDSRVYIAL
jgi:hypothetical protein